MYQPKALLARAYKLLIDYSTACNKLCVEVSMRAILGYAEMKVSQAFN